MYSLLYWMAWYEPSSFGILALETLIPLVIVALEVVVFDPLEPPKNRWFAPGLIAGWRERRAARRHKELTDSEEPLKAAITERYRFERNALKAIHARPRDGKA